MGQTWGSDPSSASLEQPATLLRRAGFWIKQLVLFPFRLLGLLLVFVLVIGGFSTWVIPDLAERHKVDMVLLVLRILDEEGAGRPFRRLGYQKTIHAGLLQLRSDGSTDAGPYRLGDAVVAVNASRTPQGETYDVHYVNGQTQNLVPTTPHTTVAPEELAAARQAISRLFSPGDRKSWSEVPAWGESVFVTSWVQKFDLTVAPRDRFPGPVGGTEDEQLWCAWQVLRCGGAPEEDLFRLPELFRETFPEKQDQQAALAWANAVYERLEKYYQFRQRAYAEIESDRLITRAYAGFQRVLPPDTEWSRLWLLHQYVGLSPAARAAARQRWLGFFPQNRVEQVLAFGESLIEERRQKGEPLPNVPDVLPVLCVIERLTATDGAGQICDNVLGKMPALGMAHLALQFAYPNDDIYYLLASGDHLELFPIRTNERGNAVYYISVPIALLIITWIAALGAQTAIQWFAAWLVLRKSTRPLWRKHLKGRGEEPWYLAVLGILLLAGVGCVTAPFSISEMIAVQIRSPLQLFLGALIATALGGLLIGSIRRLAALFLVACGVDIEETWADEILGIILGGLALYHFGNDFLAIGLFALSDFLPGLLFVGLRRLLRRREPTPPAATPAPVHAAPALPALPAGRASGIGWTFDDLGR